jgi:hypothetical protein
MRRPMCRPCELLTYADRRSHYIFLSSWGFTLTVADGKALRGRRFFPPCGRREKGVCFVRLGHKPTVLQLKFVVWTGQGSGGSINSVSAADWPFLEETV